MPTGPAFYDRVRETSTTTGTGPYTLAGAVAGFRSFSVVGNGNSCVYLVEGGTDWEINIGTYTSSGTQLSRDVLIASSTGSAINWTAGTRKVALVHPAFMSNFAGAHVYRLTSRSIPHNVGTDVDFNAEAFDTHDFHSNTVNNTRLTIPTGLSGVYMVGANFEYASNPTGDRGIRLVKNGSTSFGRVFNPAPAVQISAVSLVGITNLQAGDYVTAQAIQTSGGSLQLSANPDTSPRFWIRYLGPLP